MSEEEAAWFGNSSSSSADKDELAQGAPCAFEIEKYRERAAETCVASLDADTHVSGCRIRRYLLACWAVR
jgi:hypothetical protein